MIRYQFSGEELPIAAAATPLEDDNWWGSAGRTLYAVAISAALALSTTHTQAAQRSAALVTEELPFQVSGDADGEHAYIPPLFGWGTPRQPFAVDELPGTTINVVEDGYAVPPPWVPAPVVQPRYGRDETLAITTIDDDLGFAPSRAWSSQSLQPVVGRDEELAIITVDDDPGFMPRAASMPVVRGWPFVERTEWLQTATSGTIDVGGESGGEITAQITSVATLDAGGESGHEIAGQEEDEATLLAGGEAGAEIVGQIASGATVASGGESGGEIIGDVGMVATMESGGEAGFEALSASGGTLGGGLRFVERQLEADEWLAHSFKRSPLDLTPIQTESKHPKALTKKHLKVPRATPLVVLPALVATIESGGEGSLDVRAQIAMSAIVESGGVGGEFAGRADVTGDDAATAALLAVLAQLDEYL